MKTNKAIKAWYAKASQSRDEYQLACSAYDNAMDTFPEGESHRDFWRVVDESRQFLIDCGAEAARNNYRLVD